MNDSQSMLDSDKPVSDVTHYPQSVAWGDMDAFGIVNNTIYHRYAENARIAYLKAIDIFSYPIFMVVAQNSCRYLKSLTYPDQLIIHTHVDELRRSSMSMSYHLYSQAHQQCVAIAEAVLVAVDHDTHKKCEIPQPLKQAIIELEHKQGHSLKVQL